MKKLADNCVLLNMTVHRPDMVRTADLNKVATDSDKAMLSLSKKLIKGKSFNKAKNYGMTIRKWLSIRGLTSQIGRGTYLIQITLVAEVMEYLAGRGITEEIIVRYGLGWNGGQNGKDVFRSRESWGLSKLANDKGRPKPLWLPMGLVIPYMRGN